MTIEQAFDNIVEAYDSWVRQALPGYDVIFNTAVKIVPFSPDQALNILDLGAGTGLFSWHIAQWFPQASFTLCDLAPAMLSTAAQRFSQYPAGFETVHMDICDLKAENTYDLVISSLAIHHLKHPEKQALFRSIYASLKTPGIFINVDQVLAPCPALQDHYWRTWLANVRSNGATEERIQQSVQRRQIYDREATLSEQLDWLNLAGFSVVDCVYKDHFIGVFMAEKTAS